MAKNDAAALAHAMRNAGEILKRMRRRPSLTPALRADIDELAQLLGGAIEAATTGAIAFYDVRIAGGKEVPPGALAIGRHQFRADLDDSAWLADLVTALQAARKAGAGDQALAALQSLPDEKPVQGFRPEVRRRGRKAHWKGSSGMRFY